MKKTEPYIQLPRKSKKQKNKLVKFLKKLLARLSHNRVSDKSGHNRGAVMIEKN